MSTVTGQMDTSGSLTMKPSGTTPLSLGTSATIKTLYKYTSGTAALQTDVLYTLDITLSAATTIDLTTSQAIPLARVRELVVINADAGVANMLKVSRGASNGVAFLPTAAHAVTVPPQDGYLRISDPNSVGDGVGNVVDGTHKTILLDPGGNTIDVSICVVGCSATS